MKERPILFSTEMVLANMEGIKTNTRRIVKGVALEWLEEFTPDFVANRDNGLCPYGYAGDWLWVRECFKPKVFAGHKIGGFDYMADHVLWLKKNNQSYTKGSGCESGERWKPSIHMPKDAARIWLEVTGIKVERLHDISEDDMLAEGIKYPVAPSDVPGMVTPMIKLGIENGPLDFMPDGFKLDGTGTIPTDRDLLFAHWAELWCKINGRESWDANPWVWAISFKVLSTTGKPLYKKLSDVKAV